MAQLNEVPAGSLDHYWGDVAVAVVQEAAAGIRDVILNQSGLRHGAPPPKGATGRRQCRARRRRGDGRRGTVMRFMDTAARRC